MDVTPLIKEGAQIIQSYGGGQFRVSGQAFEGAVLVYPDKSVSWQGAKDFQSLSADDFDDVLTHASEDVDVVLLGTGSVMKIIPPALRNALKDKGLSVDSMDTGAACRTYNVLMAEGRRVVAALLPTDVV